MPHRENCIENDIVGLMYSSTVPFSIVGILYAATTASTAYDQGTAVPLAFSALMLVATALRVAVSVAFYRAQARRMDHQEWSRRYLLAGVPYALLLGLYPAYAFHTLTGDWQIPLIALLFSYPYGMLVRVSVRPSVARWLLLLTMAPPLVSAAFVGTQAHWILTILIVCYIATALEMIRFLNRVIVGRMRLEREKEDLALSDDLTSLPNRRHFRFILDHLHIQASTGSSRYAVLLVDLDGFKEVNDSHGHAAGDAVLIEVAQRLTEAVRESDRVVRLGGDEFAVLLTPPFSDGDLETVAAQVIEMVSAPIDIGAATVSVGASIGAAVSDAQDSADDIVRRADEAMYEAKRAGRGRVVVAG